MLSKITAATVAVSLIALGACAPMETQSADSATQDAQQAVKPAGAQAASKPMESSTAASSATAVAAQAAITNPALIEFDAQSVQLNSQAQALIAQLTAPAKRAGKIVITGYSDKRKSGNAKEVALSRASKVKNELVKNGVPAKNIRIKYITEQAKNLAKVELATEPLRVDNSKNANVKN